MGLSEWARVCGGGGLPWDLVSGRVCVEGGGLPWDSLSGRVVGGAIANCVHYLGKSVCSKWVFFFVSIHFKGYNVNYACTCSCHCVPLTHPPPPSPRTDMTEGCVGDMVELGITESFQVKRQVLLSAAEAAEMILRVDDILKSAPR